MNSFLPQEKQKEQRKITIKYDANYICLQLFRPLQILISLFVFLAFFAAKILSVFFVSSMALCGQVFHLAELSLAHVTKLGLGNEGIAPQFKTLCGPSRLAREVIFAGNVCTLLGGGRAYKKRRLAPLPGRALFYETFK